MTEFLDRKHVQLLKVLKTNDIETEIIDAAATENESIYINCALSEMLHRNGNCNVKNINISKLEGLRKYFDICYLNEVIQLNAVFREWNSNNIRYFIFNSAALKIGKYFEHYIYTDTFLVYVDHNINTATEIAIQEGFTKKYCPEGILLEKEHSRLIICTDVQLLVGISPDHIMDRSILTKLATNSNFNTEIFIPCAQDIMTLWICYIGKTYVMNPNPDTLFYLLWTLMDFENIIRNYNTTIVNKTNAAVLSFVIDMYCDIFDIRKQSHHNIRFKDFFIKIVARASKSKNHNITYEIMKQIVRGLFKTELIYK